MRHTSSQASLPPSSLSKNFLQSISPSQLASPSVAQYSAGLAHDARNMLAAMDIYCELLSSPGVLKPDDKHLLDELRLLRDSSGKLLDRLLVEALKCLASTDQIQGANKPQARARNLGSAAPALNSDLSADSPDLAGRVPAFTSSPASLGAIPPSVLFDPADTFGDADSTLTINERDASSSFSAGHSADLPALPSTERRPAAREGGKRVQDVAAELRSNLPMLSALAGPRVHVSLEVESCPGGEVFIPPVDLTRVLINLVRNAAEAMSIGGRILISATSAMAASAMPGGKLPGNTVLDHARPGKPGPTPAGPAEFIREPAPAVLIAIEDNGPGIPLSLLDRIFDLQVSSATQEESLKPRMQFRPRGLGLRIVRDFVEASGGSVRALRLPDRGSRFEIVLPMVTVKVTQVGSER